MAREEVGALNNVAQQRTICRRAYSVGGILRHRRSNPVFDRANSADALRDLLGIHRMPSAHQDFESTKHFSRAERFRNVAFFYFYPYRQVPFDTCDRVDDEGF